MSRLHVIGGLLLVGIGCSILVEPTSDVRCESSPDCPVGYMCTDGLCVEMCRPPGTDEICNMLDDDCDGLVDESLNLITETCNAQDDDCDGAVDEGHDANGNGTIEPGESFDKDGDGFNVCGSTCTDPDESCEIVPELSDCNDDPPSEGDTGGFEINPEADEVCDGTDHDCDGSAFPLGEPDPVTCIAPRDGALCGTDMACETDRGCVPLDCSSGRACLACGERQVCEDGICQNLTCDPTMCAADEYCELGNSDCVDRKVNGSDCERNEECLSNACVPGEQLGLPRAMVCFDPCCRDTECPPGQFCWGPGTGAQSCLTPRAEYASVTGRSAVGTGGAGAACSGGGDCRSGRCDGSSCYATCGRSSDCPMSCGLTDEGSGCRSGGDLGASCTSDSQCATEFCFDDICLSQACTHSPDCPDIGGPGELEKFCGWEAIDGSAILTCGYDQPALLVENRGYGEECQVSFCEDFPSCCGGILCSDGQTRYGCDSRTCINNRCTQACCRDETCPAGSVCRPQLTTFGGSTFYPMYCVAAP